MIFSKLISLLADDVKDRSFLRKKVKISLKNIYLGKIDLHEDNVEGIMTAACLLQLPTVRDACSAFFRKLLHPSNCVGIRLFADAQCCLGLRDAAKVYMEDNFQV